MKAFSAWAFPRHFETGRRPPPESMANRILIVDRLVGQQLVCGDSPVKRNVSAEASG
jgi:hypothetical protein